MRLSSTRRIWACSERWPRCCASRRVMQPSSTRQHSSASPVYRCRLQPTRRLIRKTLHAWQICKTVAQPSREADQAWAGHLKRASHGGRGMQDMRGPIPEYRAGDCGLPVASTATEQTYWGREAAAGCGDGGPQGLSFRCARSRRARVSSRCIRCASSQTTGLMPRRIKPALLPGHKNARSDDLTCISHCMTDGGSLATAAYNVQRTADCKGNGSMRHCCGQARIPVMSMGRTQCLTPLAA